MTITRGAPFAGDVALSQTGAPTGVTVTFTPATVAAGATTSTVNVAVAGTVAAGIYPVTINAAATGLTTATATLSVVVVAGNLGSFALAATPTTLTAAAGAAPVTSAITITRTAPFTGPVALAVTGAPAGVTASVTPASAAGNTATLSVSSTASAVNGTYALTVRGTASGLADATTGVSVTVTGGSSAQSIALALNPAALSAVVGGASVTSTVTITRNGGFTGGVNLALTGALAGVTATVSPNTNVTGTTATITVQAGASVPLGTYNITLTGTGTGIPNATATLPVTYTTSGGGGSATITFCPEDAPIWAAAQDGAAGAWTRVNPTTGATYTFSFPSGKGGVAWVDTVGTGTDLTVAYATAAEFAALSSTVNFGGCFSNKNVNGSVSGVSATEAANVSLGGASAFVIPAVSSSFTLNNVANGPQDLVGTRLDAATSAVNWVILRRALNPANNSTLPVLAFGTEGFAPATANVTFTGLGADTANVVSLFTGVRGSTFALLSFIQDYINASGAKPYVAIPTAQLQANELQELEAFASEQNNSNSDRSAGLYFTTVSNRTVAFGPKLSTPTVTKAATTPYVQPNVSMTSQTEYNRFLSAEYRQSSINRSANVAATAGYYGGAPATWNVTLPNLSAAAGWNNVWGLQNGTAIDWEVFAQGGAIPFLDATIADGTVTRSASIQSSTPLTVRAARTGAFGLEGRLLDALRERNRSPLH